MVWHIYKNVTADGFLQEHIKEQVRRLHKMWRSGKRTAWRTRTPRRPSRMWRIAYRILNGPKWVLVTGTLLGDPRVNEDTV